MSTPLLHDAVLFDLDGTLVATDRFWLPAARAGAHRALLELGRTRALPEAEAWMALVGGPLRDGLARLFPELTPAELALLQARCEEEEHALLRAGGAALLPGARELLEELRAQGLQLAIASNCSQAYLDHMLAALGLGELVDEARCLESPGVHDKADMLAQLLLAFGTRRALMVGDRSSDCAAAQANGLPHVHYNGAFARPADARGAQAVVAQLGELVPLLEARALRLEAIGAQLGLLEPERVRVLGVTGDLAAGKTMFAEDLVERVRAAGRPAALLSTRQFSAQAASPSGAALAELDWRRLASEVLDPKRAGQGLALHLAGGAVLELPAHGLLVLEGEGLLEPCLATLLDRVLHLTLAPQDSLTRVAARAGPLAAEALLDARRRLLPRQSALAEHSPAARADLCLDGLDPLQLPACD